MTRGHQRASRAKTQTRYLFLYYKRVLQVVFMSLITVRVPRELKEKITIYDAIYIALAEDKGTTFFTSDRRQYNAAKRYARTIFVG